MRRGYEKGIKRRTQRQEYLTLGPGHWTLDAGVLEPTLLVLDVSPDEVFVRLGEVDDSFDETDNRSDSTGHKCDDDLNNSFGGIAKDEFMNAKPAQQDPANARNQFLLGSECFPICHLPLVYSLHRLVATDTREWRLAGGAVLRRVVILRAAFRTIFAH